MIDDRFGWLDEALKDLPGPSPSETDGCYELNHNMGACQYCGGNPREKAKRAIIAKIDEHYIGKGEGHSFNRGEYEQHYRGDGTLLCSDCMQPESLHKFSPTTKLYTEQEVEQRCIEARIDELQQFADFLSSIRIYDQDSAMKLRYHFDQRIKSLRKESEQLSTNNKDTLERSE